MEKCEGCYYQGWITCLAEGMEIDQKDCHLTPAHQTIIDAMIRGKVPDDAIAIMLHALESTDFAIDDAEERENGDKFITIWYRQQRKEDGDEL